MTRIHRLSVADALTIGNAVLGFLAITYLIDQRNRPGSLLTASLLILVAVILDGLDGYAARRWGTTHSRGVVLDSLADAVSFCVAPALLLYTEFYDPARGTAWTDLPNAFAVAASTLVAIFGFVRLARFTTTTHAEPTFLGFPTPANAVLLVSLVQLFGVRGLIAPAWPFVLGASLLASVLMVSEVPYPKLGDPARLLAIAAAAAFGALLALAVLLQVAANLALLLLFTLTLGLSVAYVAGGPFVARQGPGEELVPVH